MGCTVHSKSALVFRTPAHFSVNQWTLHYNFKEISNCIFSWNVTSLFVGSKSDFFSWFLLGYVVLVLFFCLFDLVWLDWVLLFLFGFVFFFKNGF